MKFEKLNQLRQASDKARNHAIDAVREMEERMEEIEDRAAAKDRELTEREEERLSRLNEAKDTLLEIQENLENVLCSITELEETK